VDAPTTTGRRVRLDNDSHAISSGHGSGSILIGSVVAAAGVLPLLRALEIITTGRVHAPLWVVGWIGGIFVVGGLFAIVLGLAGVRRARRAAARRLESPDRPEVWDREWDPEAVADGSLRRAVQGVVAASFFVAFLVPFAWWAFLSGKGPTMVKVITGVFVLIAVLVVCTAGLRLARTVRFGESRLRLPHFPLRPGEQVELRLEVAGDLSELEHVDCELRFVEEVWEITTRGNNERTQQRVRYALWQSECKVEAPSYLEAGGGTIPLAIQLPPDQPELTTHVSGDPTRYWELEVRVARAGLDYVGAFQLPVYGTGTESREAWREPVVAGG